MRHILCALSLGLCSLSCLAKDIVIGQIAPYTQSAQNVGAQLQSGIQLYFDWVNRSGGVNGNRLKLVGRDRELEGPSVVADTRALIEESKPIALVGLMGTSYMNALIKEDVLNQAAIPVVGVRSGAIALHAPLQPYVFHTRASYQMEAEKAVTYLATIGYRRFAVFAENSQFGEEGAAHFSSAIERRGLALVARGGYESGKGDVKDAIRKIDAARPDAILAVGNSGAVADFYKGYREHNKGTPLVTLSTVDAGVVLKRIGKEQAHGLGIARVVPDPLNRRSPVVREFQDVGRQLRGAKFEQNQAELEGFIAAKVLVDALRRCGNDLKPSTLKAELERTKGFDVGGFLIGFSPKDHSGSRFVDVGIIGSEGRMLH
jgi:ABC-type branched-subunit amino acid transport system substrate-binding protein